VSQQGDKRALILFKVLYEGESDSTANKGWADSRRRKNFTEPCRSKYVDKYYQQIGKILKF
jgi:hypothetical protein